MVILALFPFPDEYNLYEDISMNKHEIGKALHTFYIGAINSDGRSRQETFQQAISGPKCDWNAIPYSNSNNCNSDMVRED